MARAPPNTGVSSPRSSAKIQYPRTGQRYLVRHIPFTGIKPIPGGLRSIPRPAASRLGRARFDRLRASTSPNPAIAPQSGNPVTGDTTMPQPHHHHCAGCNTPIGHQCLPPRPTEHAPMCDCCLANGAIVAWDSATVRAYRAAGQTVTWYAGDVIAGSAPNPLAPCLCPAGRPLEAAHP